MSTGCKEFLDIVPDSQLTLDMIFYMKEDAWNGLAKCYSYLPLDGTVANSPWLLGDEYMSCLQEQKDAWWPGMTIMRGKQNATDPQLGYWQGSGGAKDMYGAIRNCNIFLDKINLTADLSPAERADWVGQVKFLKAYYHFIMLRHYGPIIISDKEVSANAVGDDIYQYRSKVEDCFQYIVNLIDEAVEGGLNETRGTADLGQITSVIAKSIKARILVYRASPFYSGNRDYFEDFLDPVDNKPYFDVFDTEAQTQAKWQDALDAVNEAIAACVPVGIELYHYEGVPYAYDRAYMDTNTVRMKTLYDLRMVVVDPWNKELIWGLSNDRGNVMNYTNIMLPERYLEGGSGDLTLNQSYSDQQLGATYHMLESYYTDNGLPIKEDLTFSYSLRNNIITTPGGEELDYFKYIGLMQPGATAIELYMNREPRFYANLGVTGGYWRAHECLITTDFFADNIQGTNATGGGGYYSGKPDNYIWTGIGIQKLVHPENKSGHTFRLVQYPIPVMRYADLLLMQAEALNELNHAPSEVWVPLNEVRVRAGIPKVEDVWSDATLARNPGKHNTQSGLREIIKAERANELAFEGYRFWDLVRWKDAIGALSQPAIGWTTGPSITPSVPDLMFVQHIKQTRKFSFRDCLWPISVAELNRNSNLIQNPGW
jgi:hypothetical protein